MSGTATDPYSGFGSQYGYYSDTETGLQLLGYRYYDPAEGRFVNRDRTEYGGGVNLYGYAANGPTAGDDPDGQCWVFVRGNNSHLGHMYYIPGPCPPQHAGSKPPVPVDPGWPGYSGQRGHQDPSQETEPGNGPIPRGRYGLVPPGKKHPGRIPIVGGNTHCTRGDFQCHGPWMPNEPDGGRKYKYPMRGPGAPRDPHLRGRGHSDGCIVLPNSALRAIRHNLKTLGGNQLVVY
ncbi:MAG: hypothetical protein KGJ62_13715 [Armatimonadetes bacterium]|nr:hypothetical protein [Armatimonadota bacterium]MDE2206235.1 hypothetical protein [Armatimonadota bacterium]